jgi:hypothetical protein
MQPQQYVVEAAQLQQQDHLLREVLPEPQETAPLAVAAHPQQQYVQQEDVAQLQQQPQQRDVLQPQHQQLPHVPQVGCYPC